MDTIKPLYTATATVTGGRNGHAESSDGVVSTDLSVPKELGGPGKPGTATPEHLFAAGYAACFGGAVDLVAKQHKLDASKAKVDLFGLHRVTRRRRLRARRQDAGRGSQRAAGRAGKSGARGAREDLPLFARHARQCERRV